LFFDSYFTSLKLEVDAVTVDDAFHFSASKTSQQPTPSYLSSELASDAGYASETATPPAPTGPPNIGPFLRATFQLLESILENDFQVNVQLTGLLSSLAAFPHPLLSSFLLSGSLVYQSSVRALPEV
jgi:hypothetical protein